jgi:chromosome segregation ATPase
MATDNNSELLALMGDLIRATDRQTTVFEQRFERLNEVMVNGFDRLENKISATNTRLDHLTERVDHLTERVDHLTEEVAELKTDMREVKAQVIDINRRLGNTFDQTGRLTEQTKATYDRLTQVEDAQYPTNTELDVRVTALENQQRKAS